MMENHTTQPSNVQNNLDNLDCDFDSLDSDQFQANYSNSKVNISFFRNLVKDSIEKLKSSIGFRPEQNFSGKDLDSLLSVLNLTICNSLANTDSDVFFSKILKRNHSRTSSIVCPDEFSNSRMSVPENCNIANSSSSKQADSMMNGLTNILGDNEANTDQIPSQTELLDCVSNNSQSNHANDATEIDFDVDQITENVNDDITDESDKEISTKASNSKNFGEISKNKSCADDLTSDVHIPDISKILTKQSTENVEQSNIKRIDGDLEDENSNAMCSTLIEDNNLDVDIDVQSNYSSNDDPNNCINDEIKHDIDNNDLSQIFSSELPDIPDQLMSEIESDDNENKKSTASTTDKKRSNNDSDSSENEISTSKTRNIKGPRVFLSSSEDDDEKDGVTTKKRKNSKTISDNDNTADDTEGHSNNETESLEVKTENKADLKKEEVNEEEEDEEKIFVPKKRSKRIASSNDIMESKSKSKFDKISSSSDNDLSDSDNKKKKKTKKRKRVVCIDLSSDENEKKNSSDSDSLNVSRKKIHKILSPERLKLGTRAAEKAEKERRKRIEEKQLLYNQLRETDVMSFNADRVILDFDKKTKEVLVEVNSAFVTHMKHHQVEGVKFLFDCTIESVEQLKKENYGSGCILAHSMGLGKTFQIVVFLHTIMTNNLTRGHIKKVLVIIPLNVAKNWVNEFEKWFTECKLDLNIFLYEMINVKNFNDRLKLLESWDKNGGIMFITITLYSQLVQGKKFSKKQQKIAEPVIQKCLLNPGPDIVIIDEGHLLKNDSTAFNKTVSQISTLRRVILTGTPLQNNLTEYFIMVDFVKPSLLGTKREFLNRFVNPINNGQHIDSTDYDVKVMKKRVHILHKLLNDCIDRRDYNVLVPYLQPKFEYVLSLRMTECQKNLYKYYLENFVDKSRPNLLADYSILRLIWSHPALLVDYYQRKEEKELEDDDSLKDFVVDDDSSSSSSNRNKKRRKIVLKASSDSEIECINEFSTVINIPKSDEQEVEKKLSSINSSWVENYLPEEAFQTELSSKFVLLLSILENCEILGDKVLVFSQSLFNLDLIERFLQLKMLEFNEKYGKELTYNEIIEKTGGISHRWVPNIDYFRIDGKVKSESRCSIIETFNDIENHRSRLMLVSTKAGSLGINLVGANRCVIFDVSWNPSHDLQAIYRIFRYGQTKPVYVYRFTAYGTMESKIYDRQIIKQSLSHRVIDEHQIQRHFKASEVSELYTFADVEEKECQVPILPKDRLLADMLLKHKSLIITYHEHDSLLVNDPTENLSEEERLTAWAEYERDKNPKPPTPPPMNMLPQFQNPQWQQYEKSLLNSMPNSSHYQMNVNQSNSSASEYLKYYHNLIQNNQNFNRQVTQAKDFNIVKSITENSAYIANIKRCYDETNLLLSTKFTIQSLRDLESDTLMQLTQKFHQSFPEIKSTSPEFPMRMLCFLFYYIQCCQHFIRHYKQNVESQLTPNILSNCLENIRQHYNAFINTFNLTNIAFVLNQLSFNKMSVKKEPRPSKDNQPVFPVRENDSVEIITLSD